MPEPIHTRALLLKTVDYGESDRIVTLLTERLGKISAMARGARRSRKRFGAALSLFVLAEAELRAQPTSNLFSLSSYSAQKVHAKISSDIAAIAHASYATELVTELCPSAQPEPVPFGQLLEMYRLLDEAPPSRERLRVFEWQMLRAAGLEPQIDVCVQCGIPIRESTAEAGQVALDADRGGILCSTCRGGLPLLSPATHHALRRISAATLHEASALVFPDASQVEVRAALAQLIGTAVGKPLKSVQFIQKLTE